MTLGGLSSSLMKWRLCKEFISFTHFSSDPKTHHIIIFSSPSSFSVKLKVMGSSPSKKKRNMLRVKDVRSLMEKIRLLRKEINGMMHEREKESRVYEREVMVFAFKEAEWKQERKKLKEEVKRLRKNLEEKEENIREMKDGLLMVKDKGCGEENEWQLLGASFLVEHMKEERARRDEAVEKWKQLYLAIKTELDDLIQRAHAGNGVYWRAEEEDMIQELRREVKDKEETIEALKAQLASAEQVYKKERDIDILRQSFRIISCKKKASRFTSCKKYFSPNIAFVKLNGKASE